MKAFSTKGIKILGSIDNSLFIQYAYAEKDYLEKSRHNIKEKMFYTFMLQEFSNINNLSFILSTQFPTKIINNDNNNNNNIEESQFNIHGLNNLNNNIIDLTYWVLDKKEEIIYNESYELKNKDFWSNIFKRNYEKITNMHKHSNYITKEVNNIYINNKKIENSSLNVKNNINKILMSRIEESINNSFISNSLNNNENIDNLKNSEDYNNNNNNKNTNGDDDDDDDEFKLLYLEPSSFLSPKKNNNYLKKNDFHLDDEHLIADLILLNIIDRIIQGFSLYLMFLLNTSTLYNNKNNSLSESQTYYEKLLYLNYGNDPEFLKYGSNPLLKDKEIYSESLDILYNLKKYKDDNLKKKKKFQLT